MLYKIVRLLLFIFVAGVFLDPMSTFAVDQDVRDFYPSAGPSPLVEARREEKAAASVMDRFEFDAFLDLQVGYDNNVDLNPRRHKDGFIQTTANAEVIYKQTENIRYKTGVDMFNTVYFKYNVNNLFDIVPYLGVDIEIMPGLISRNRITYDFFSFPNEKESTFNGLYLSTMLRHFALKDFYHEGGFEWLMRWYPDQKVVLTNLQLGDNDRRDNRYRVKYNLGYYTDLFFIRVDNEFSPNDSNDVYQEFYDWWTYRLKPAVMIFFTDDLYADVSLIYKYVHYKDRRRTEDINEKVRDHMYIFNTSLYYDITENLTIEFTYTYTENTSNDPFERYSASLITGGMSYYF